MARPADGKYTTIYVRTQQLLDLRFDLIRNLCPFIRFAKVGPSTSHLSFTQWVLVTEYPDTLRAFLKEYNEKCDNPWLRILEWMRDPRECNVKGAGFPEFVPYEGENGALDV